MATAEQDRNPRHNRRQQSEDRNRGRTPNSRRGQQEFLTKPDEIELLESSKETNRCDDSDGDEGSSKYFGKF